MRTERSTLWPFYLSISAIIGVLMGIYISNRDILAYRDHHYQGESLDKLQRVLVLIKNQYVENVNVDSLMDFAINDILHRLDPHSSFIDSAHSGTIEEEITGRYFGAGAEFTMIRDTTAIMSVFPGSPAEAAGLKSGDKLIAVNGINLFETPFKGNLQSVISLIRNSNKEKVRISFLRKGHIETRTLTKDWISIPSIHSSFYLNNGVAVIGIERFAENTYQNFLREARKLKIDTARGLILDLRDNPGGLMIEAIRIVREFLTEGDTVVIVEDRNKSREVVRTLVNGRYRTIPLVILVNESSASASEVLAGAVQDNSRGIIAGTPTFGKGLVQEESILPDGSRVRITTARYYTPTGRSIQAPYLPGIHEKNMIHKKNHTSKNGKTLREGGGIHPDVLLNFKEINHFAHSHQFLINPGEELIEYVSLHGDALREGGFKRFLLQFNPTFEEAIQLMGISLDAAGSTSTDMKELSILHVKSTLAYMIFGPQAGRQVIKMNDPSIQMIADQIISRSIP